MKLFMQAIQKHRAFLLLMLASIILLFSFLGLRDLWTQEHRWAEIVAGMFYRQDFLHPFLGADPYYDKPLLSYWLIIVAASIVGEISATALRLPSAMSALIAIIAIYRIGATVHSKRFGLLAGWMLLTTFYFLFWARTSSADMLNLSGILVAFCWYIEKRDATSFSRYAIFFLILAVTSLCKGLTGAIIPLIAIFPDLVRQKRFKMHLNWKFVLALLPALIVYFLPFWASTHFGSQGYGTTGLEQVYRENVLRYFQPFDHKGPLTTYFIFLPIYLLPWTVFFIPALCAQLKRFKQLSWHSQWFLWIVVLTFLFFTLSGSRRNYYALCIVPFALLMTADWIIVYGGLTIKRAAHITAGVFFGLYILYFLILQPLNYRNSGTEVFVKNLQSAATATRPWNEWRLILLDTKTSLNYYLALSPVHPVLGTDERTLTSANELATRWPILCKQNGTMIFITRELYRKPLSELLEEYIVIDTPPTLLEKLKGKNDDSNTVAFIPTATAHCTMTGFVE